MKTTIETFEQLGHACNRSKSTVHAWTRHPKWPFPTTPPWPASLAEDAMTWAENTLDGSHDKEIVERVDAPGPDHVITDAEIPGILTTWFPTITQEIVSNLRLWEVSKLANAFTSMFGMCLVKYGREMRGEKFNDQMVPAFWNRLSDDLRKEAQFVDIYGHACWMCLCDVIGYDPDTGKPKKKAKAKK